MIVICFFKTLIDEKPDYINLSVIPKTNEEYISVTYGCLRFIDSYRFLDGSLDELVKTLDTFPILKKEFPRNAQSSIDPDQRSDWELLNKN